MFRTSITTAVACLVFFAGGTIGADDNWPQFRGPNGSGIAAEGMRGPVEFGPGKNEVWKTEVPPGLSSPCVWGERIFITACDAASKKLETLCLDRKDGRILWREAVVAERIESVHKTNSPACATPACDGERVYVYFGSYGLVAYTLDGKKAWELRLPIPTMMFGTGTSPIIAGDVVVLNRLQAMANPFAAKKNEDKGEPAKSEVLAVDRKTGQVAWRTAMTMAPMGRSHLTPALCKSSTGDEVIVAGGGRVTALDAATGKAKWFSDKLTPVATASPLIAGDRVFLNCTGLAGDVDKVTPLTFEQALAQWDKNKDGKLQRDELPDDLAVFTRHRADHEGDFTLKQWFFSRADTNRDGALSKEEWDEVFKNADRFAENAKPALVSIRLGGTDDVSASHLAWTTAKGVPEVPTMLVVGRRLYAVRNGGLVTCFDADSGKILYEERLGASGSYYASPISDGVNVYFVSQPGVVTVLKAGDTFERVASVDLKDEVSATPALVGGRLIVRAGKWVYAFGER